MNEMLMDAMKQYGITPLPAEPVVAMAYVPYQISDNIYSAEQGINVGTMFPELNKPFKHAAGGENDE